MSATIPQLDFDRLFRLRLVVARFGEMDVGRWWNTGDAGRRTAVLGRAGAVLMSRGFRRTHHFAQARVVFEVARARCEELFNLPGAVTLWNLTAAIEDQFDARWARWIEERDVWTAFFKSMESPPTDLLDALESLDLLGPVDREAVSRLRRTAEGRAVPIPGVHALSDTLITHLAAGFSRGEPGKLAVPFAQIEK